MTATLAHTAALVTGASSGIGAATAKALAEQGAAVALLARRADRLQDLKRDIESAGGTVFAFAGNVTQDSAVAKFAEPRSGACASPAGPKSSANESCSPSALSASMSI